MREFQYYDDNVTADATVINLQISANQYNEAYKRFEMQTNVKKTKILIQPALGQATRDVSINIDG